MDVEFNYKYSSFLSEAEQYTIFKLTEEPVDFLSNFTLKEKTGTTDESCFDSYLAGHVHEEQYPKWENNYFQVQGITSTVEVSSITVLYFPEALELVFLIKSSG